MKAQLIDDKLVWLPKYQPDVLLKNPAKYHKEFISVCSHYQVGDIVEIDCKECNGDGGDYGGNSEVGDIWFECGKCTDGQQSYEITGPIELVNTETLYHSLAGLYKLHKKGLASYLSKEKNWLCVSKAERIDI